MRHVLKSPITMVFGDLVRKPHPLTDCARHHALCEEALGRVLAKIASRSVRVYYVGVTDWGFARFHGIKNKVYDDIEFVAGLLGPAKAGLGPAEAVSLEKFLQAKCKLGDERLTPYQKYDPDKRNLPYHVRSARLRRHFRFIRCMWHVQRQSRRRTLRVAFGTRQC